MNKYLIVFLGVFFLQSCEGSNDEPIATTSPSTVNWSAAADNSSFALIDNFWNSNEKYFNNNSAGDATFGYWPQAHALDILVDAQMRSKTQLYTTYINQWYDGVKKKNGNTFYNVFYDDMEWIALAMLRTYALTNDSKFKTAVDQVWGNIQTGWNETMGGGIAWRKDMLYYKNTPANAPACILAARLYQMDKKQSDLEWAMKIYSWLKDNLYEPGNGFVYDGTNRLKNGQKDNWRFTYNQGVFIGAAVELFKITGDKSFLNDAIKAADYTLNNDINGNDRILQDEGDGDGGLFKGIFIRYFTQLILLPDLDLASRKRYVIFLKHNAETLWNEGTNKNPVLFGTYWKTKPSAKTGLSQQLSGNMLMEAMDLLARNKML